MKKYFIRSHFTGWQQVTEEKFNHYRAFIANGIAFSPEKNPALFREIIARHARIVEE